MKILIAGVVVVAAVVVLILLLRRAQQPKPDGEALAGRAMSLEQKLETLANCGLRLAEPFTADDLLKSWGRAEYEKPGYDLVLVGLGMTEEGEPWRNQCVNLWHFDTECIEDDGDYKRIAGRMSEMAQGSLPLENIQDHVDVENGKAWLSFTFRGKDVRIECKVQDDWVDTSVFGRFVELLAQSDSSKVYMYYSLGGQDCIIGCVSKENLKKLNEKGIGFVPLK